MLNFFESTTENLFYEFYSLQLLAIFFLLLSILVKGKEATKAIQMSFSSTIFNITLMTFNIIFLPLVLIYFSFVSNYYDFRLIDSSHWNGINFILVIFLAVFLGDFIGYWRHRLEHSLLLWPSHAVHHSDAQMTWLTLQRFHPFNRVSTYVIDSGFLLIIGLPLDAIIVNNLVRHYYGYFIHADLPWTYGHWGKIFVSPVMHRWHHALEKEAHNTNYATVFSIFDRCFGTYRVPGICNEPLGVLSHQGRNFLAQLIYPLKLSSYKLKDDHK